MLLTDGATRSWFVTTDSWVCSTIELIRCEQIATANKYLSLTVQSSMHTVWWSPVDRKWPKCSLFGPKFWPKTAKGARFFCPPKQPNLGQKGKKCSLFEPKTAKFHPQKAKSARFFAPQNGQIFAQKTEVLAFPYRFAPAPVPCVQKRKFGIQRW